MLTASWDFVRRHRRKIVAGTALAATAYGTKRLLESGTLRDFVQQFLADNDGPHEQQQIALNEECMNEARRHFLFDVHQQSCDKMLNSLARQLAQRIEVRFDTTALLEELRTAGDAARKIDIWQQLKVCSIAKLLAVLAAFPLVTLVLKTQKSMVCQQVYRQTIQQQKQQSSTVDNGTSMFQTGIHFMKSFFYEPSTADASTTSTTNTNSTTGPKAQKLFNDSVQFLLSDGLDLLFGVMEKIAADIFGPVPLQEPVSSMDLHFLLERARARLKAVGAANNFSEFVVPTAQLNLQINDSDGAKLQALLKHFVLILRTQRCRQLMEDFAGRYMEALLQQLDDSFPSPAAAEDGGGGNSSNKLSLPLAKLIPRICNTFSTLTASGQHSVFFETLTSIELHQFTLFVSECSKEERGSDMLDLVI